MRLAGVSALVTGGASGLGLVSARSLVARGAHVTLVDLANSEGDSIAERLGDSAARQVRTQFVVADVTSESEMQAAVSAAEGFGPLRVLVHCAGRGGDRTRILDRDGRPGGLDSFRQVIDVNLIGTYNTLRLSAASMARNDLLDGDRGACVLTASVAAFDGQIGQTSYTASKAAIHGMTLVAARDLASRGIRINTIAPGTFDTPMLSRLRDDIRDALASAVPHPRRLGRPDDFAALAVSMLENAYLNGETVRLDGAIRMPPR